MKTIWKHILTPPMTIADLPGGSQVLSVQVQRDREGNHSPTIWFLVPDIDAPKECRTFRIYGTGHAINKGLNLKYIGTFQLSWMVFHLFEEIK